MKHGDKRLRQLVLAAKESGMPDAEIGGRFGISFNYLQGVITEAYGVSISLLERPKKVRNWAPKDFREEATSVWSFKQRGNWATHDGRYRGNWSPYIPRNVILKYSKPGDLVLDYFVGGGTTAVEAKLLGRRCIARDINPSAIAMTRRNLDFALPQDLFGDDFSRTYEPEVDTGDARELSDIADSSIDLICAHPPYAGIIKYSSHVQGDLSELSLPEFLSEMGKVARESLRVLKPGGKCAILIGDSRRAKHVVPIGFQTIRVFLEAGFALRELVIKRQHNCKTTGFWYSRSIQHNFLLLAHEYLPIFEKPIADKVAERRPSRKQPLPHRALGEKIRAVGEENLETTTVWIFPKERLQSELKRNLLRRFAVPGETLAEVQFGDGNLDLSFTSGKGVSLVYVRPPSQALGEKSLASYRAALTKLARQARDVVPKGGFLIVDVKDVRYKQKLLPTGLSVWEDMLTHRDFAIKEIVVVLPEDSYESMPKEYLDIVHRYLLVYVRK